MKTTLLFGASMFVAVAAFGQGQIQFANINGTGAAFQAPIYDVDAANPAANKSGNTVDGRPAGNVTYGGALLSGTGYTAELWGNGWGHSVDNGGAAPDPTTFVLLGHTTFRTGLGAGFITTLTVTVPNAPLSGNAGNIGNEAIQGSFQFRAWNNLGGTIATWAAALNPAVPHAASAVVNSSAAGLGGTGDPPATPPFLTGMRSFQLAVVPEPSAIALGVIGLGSLMFLRRRK